MLNFKNITLIDKENVQQHTLSCEHKNCDLAFANLFIWQFLYNTKIAFKDDFMFVKYFYNNKLYYMLPTGNGDLVQAIKIIMQDARIEGQRFCMQGLVPKMCERLQQLMPDNFNFLSNRNYSDYLYLRDDLVNLSGKKFQPKRNHINQFLKNYKNYQFTNITPELIPQCLKLEYTWANSSTTAQEGIALAAEQRAINIALENYEALGLSGGALLVDNKVVAFTFGSQISECTFDVSVEKANTEIIGVYAMVNNLFAKKIPEKFIYINREEDLGIEGLRKAKLSYQPIDILEKFTVHLNPNSALN
jgi:hypothetical protein